MWNLAKKTSPPHCQTQKTGDLKCLYGKTASSQQIISFTVLWNVWPRFSFFTEYLLVHFQLNFDRVLPLQTNEADLSRPTLTTSVFTKATSLKFRQSHMFLGKLNSQFTHILGHSRIQNLEGTSWYTQKQFLLRALFETGRMWWEKNLNFIPGIISLS